MGGIPAGRRAHLDIRVREMDVGLHPEALPLNPAFRPEVPILRARLEIRCAPEDPERSFRALLQPVLAVCPGLERHRCRGEERYHVPGSDADPAGPAGPPFEAALALAHLIEHLSIDAIAYILDAVRIAGATGACREDDHLFDLFVECPDPRAADLAMALAVGRVSRTWRGEPLDGLEPLTLEIAREVYRRRPAAVSLEGTARRLGAPPDRARRSLACLERSGFALPAGWTMNFSGSAWIRLRPAA